MTDMWEDAATIEIFGIKVYTFGLYVALGMALGLILLWALLRRAKWQKGTAALTGALSMACGFLVSRLFFCFMDQGLGGPVPLKGVLLVTGGGYSMMGALLGACMGGILAAKLTGQNPARLLDFLAPALLLFVACERLGERHIEDFGISRPLVGDLLKGSFLAVEGDYDWALATFLLEAITALILALVLLWDVSQKRRAGDSFLLFLLLFGASQVIMESLRFDQHMHLSFVGLQQVMSILLLAAGVVVLALRRMKEKRALAITALAILPVVAGIGVGLEFAIDRTTVNRYLLYALFIFIVAVPVWLGIRLRKEA